MITIMIDTTAASDAEINAFEELNGYQQLLKAVKAAQDGLPIRITIGIPLPDGGVYWSESESPSYPRTITNPRPKLRPLLKLVPRDSSDSI